MGGLSGEREVSFRSGKNCLNALLARGYRAIGIDAVRDVAQRLDEMAWRWLSSRFTGRYGEDGTIQGLLEMMGIPYTGSGSLRRRWGCTNSRRRRWRARAVCARPTTERSTWTNPRRRRPPGS